ncbi:MULTISPECIES: CvfB family protein [Shewanella]|uniref:GntR family transcriptional regulator n=2 Tax=Shewanella TaxID=22 RepID=A0A975ALJ0_9GAMM|nr:MULTISPECIES: S1-like domain-containing RNA-binding protein [Shewanella]QSX31497.1 GntR family transcriptional regulator [Shewanella cyperi]QSX38718.1 GntR family transcriptional regulator [Shewanella sedimentimangrovi]QSX42277.1 GntR family transcriptional regulator [Shewanella cyperi]
MIQIGKTCRLQVVKQVNFGVYLNAEQYGQVLLPNKVTPKDCQVGDWLDVFLYLDSEDQLIATTARPKAQVGEFALLKVVSISRVGAFLDWGLDKDLLLPFAEQKRPPEEGRSVLVYIHINHADDRIVASAKLDKFLDKTPAFYKPGQKVDLIIAGTSDLGYKAIVNQAHWGVLYNNEVFKKLRFGQQVQGYVKQVRHDGKLDLQLQRGNREELDSHAKLIMDKLRKAGGFLPLTDKTDADVIYAELGMSKKAFKKSIGGLFKAGQLSIDNDGLRIAE